MTACATGGLGWGVGALGMVAVLGFWALVIWGGLQLYRSSGHGGGGAQRTLARRFAEGHIDEQEYVARLEVLRNERSLSDWGGRL